MLFSGINKYGWISLIALILWGFTARAQYNIPPKPPVAKQTSLYDYINLLTKEQQNLLKTKLVQYADSTSTQIVIAIISSTQGEDISLLGAKWGQKWGIGQKDRDNGIFILLAKDDRRVDINTGYGIETIVTDRMAEQIINRIMVPQFKTGNYYGGLDQGADALFEALKGEYNEDRSFDNNKPRFPLGMIIIFIFIILFIILRNRNNDGNGGGGGGSLLDVIILSHMGRSSGYGGGGFSGGGGGYSGGGGFGGGFGGGGFSGGGAGGSW